MAYDKIIPVRSRLDRCVDYVLNREKTDLALPCACYIMAGIRETID